MTNSCFPRGLISQQRLLQRSLPSALGYGLCPAMLKECSTAELWHPDVCKRGFISGTHLHARPAREPLCLCWHRILKMAEPKRSLGSTAQMTRQHPQPIPPPRGRRPAWSPTAQPSTVCRTRMVTLSEVRSHKCIQKRELGQREMVESGAEQTWRKMLTAVSIPLSGEEG